MSWILTESHSSRRPRRGAARCRCLSCTFVVIAIISMSLRPAGPKPRKSSAKLQLFSEPAKFSEENFELFSAPGVAPAAGTPGTGMRRPPPAALPCGKRVQNYAFLPTPPNFIPKIFPKIMFFNISRSRQKSYENTRRCKPVRYGNTHKSPKIHSTFWI